MYSASDLSSSLYDAKHWSTMVIKLTSRPDLRYQAACRVAGCSAYPHTIHVLRAWLEPEEPQYSASGLQQQGECPPSRHMQRKGPGSLLQRRMPAPGTNDALCGLNSHARCRAVAAAPAKYSHLHGCPITAKCRVASLCPSAASRGACHTISSAAWPVHSGIVISVRHGSLSSSYSRQVLPLQWSCCPNFCAIQKLFSLVRSCLCTRLVYWVRAHHKAQERCCVRHLLRTQTSFLQRQLVVGFSTAEHAKLCMTMSNVFCACWMSC